MFYFFTPAIDILSNYNDNHYTDSSNLNEIYDPDWQKDGIEEKSRTN